MRILALSDPHLSTVRPKPMDVFGQNWKDHPARIAENWRRVVRDDDLVLVPGDISWAMRLEEAAADLAVLGALPGRKILLRGNHDYWWSAIGKVRATLAPGMMALQNDALVVGGFIVMGARGWRAPGEKPAKYDLEPEGAPPGAAATPGHYQRSDDEKIYWREVERLKLSLQAAEKLRKKAPGARLVAMTHFPAVLPRGVATAASDILEAAGVEACVYGHLHGPDVHRAFRGPHGGVRYVFAACDAIDFTPVLVAE
jgi:predicted phosphohydrolase